jgi:hypothetical protein
VRLTACRRSRALARAVVDRMRQGGSLELLVGVLDTRVVPADETLLVLPVLGQQSAGHDVARAVALAVEACWRDSVADALLSEVEAELSARSRRKKKAKRRRPGVRDRGGRRVGGCGRGVWTAGLTTPRGQAVLAKRVATEFVSLVVREAVRRRAFLAREPQAPPLLPSSPPPPPPPLGLQLDDDAAPASALRSPAEAAKAARAASQNLDAPAPPAVPSPPDSTRS